jgi:hypothetical protein
LVAETCLPGFAASTEGPFVSYLAGARAGGGFNQVFADPESQQLSIDVDIAAFSGVVAADADLLPRHIPPRWRRPVG